MRQNVNLNGAKNDIQREKYLKKISDFGERRAEMLKLEILYQKILKKYEV